MNGTVLVCLDKFRGSLTAAQACAAVSDGVVDAGGHAVAMPVADGGEGTVDALVRAGYDEVCVEVTGPTGEPVRAAFAVRGDRAVVELAQASGLEVLPDGWLAPLTADTYGTGELIRAALDHGCRDLVLAVGGSATTDGGAGLLRALGARVTTASDQPVGPGGGALTGTAHVDLSRLDPRLARARVTLASDVDNPLTGPDGAAAVFAPQKGATPRDVDVLERGLRRFAAAMAAVTGRDRSGEPGAGAAGGTGFAALAALNARRTSGADFVLREIGVEDALGDASLVVVGEGRFDEQSLRGKAPFAVAEAARRRGVPVVVVAGSVGLTAERLRDLGVVAAWSLLDRAGDLDAAMGKASALLRDVGSDLVARGPGTTGPEVVDLGFARVDVAREARQGLPEVVYGSGKTPEQIIAITRTLLRHNDGPVLATRVDRDVAASVLAAVPEGSYDGAARLLVWRPAPSTGFGVVVAAAGTADLPVAREAAAVAAATGLDVTTVTDVGVAGLHRLLAEQDRLRAADTVIVVAGMEGALASAIGGLVACPVVAVPTSTGYGAGLDGITALLAMHASCAAGITVVNIDSGFGAAMAAFRLARVAGRTT